MTVGKIVGSIVAVFAFIVALSLFFGTWYSVDAGYSGVVMDFGAPSGTAGPGFHFKIPFTQSVSMIKMQSSFLDFSEDSYSQDQQDATVKFSVNFHVIPGEETHVVTNYQDFDGLVEKVLRQRGSAIFKDVFGGYTAQSATQDRAKLNSDFLKAMQDSVQGTPMAIESVQVKDIKFSPDYEAAIAAKQQATVKVLEQQQILDQEKIKAQITVTQAQAQADSQIAVATANAKATQIQGDAQAEVIKAQGDALKDNPGIIEYMKAQKWDGKLPSVMPPNSTLPFMNVQVPSTPAQ